MTRQASNHPWLISANNRTLQTNKFAFHNHFYAVDAEDNVYAFRKERSRTEWILHGEGRNKIKAYQMKLKKYRDSPVIRFDEIEEKNLIIAYINRTRKER